MKGFTRIALTMLTFSLLGQQVAADFMVTRAFRSATNAEFERLFLNEVTRNGSTISVGQSAVLNSALAENQRIWTLFSVRDHGQIVYGAYDPDDLAALDALFVVNLRQPGITRQLTPPRTSPADETIIIVAANGNSARIAYVQRNLSTNQDTIYLADSRNPGRASVVAQLPAGDLVGNQLVMSPDGSTIAYRVVPATGSEEVAVTFVNRPVNSTIIYTNNALTNYSPVEYAFSDDSSRLVWIDTGGGSEPGPLQSVLLDALTGSISNVIQVSASDQIDERVSEFAIKPGSNFLVAYRSFPADELSPSDTYLANLVTPGSVTKLNNGPFRGAAFTTWEDVAWRGNTVLYNSTEDMLLRADLFSVAENDPGNTAILSRGVPFSTDRGSRAAGISHFVQSPDDDKTAMIDGDPALNLFVIDRFNIGASTTPFTLGGTRSMGDFSDPNDTPPRFSPGSDMLAMIVREENAGGSTTQNLHVAAANSNASDVPVLATESPVVFDFLWFAADAFTSSPPTAMAAAVLPASRSGLVGSTLTAFVTLLNGGGVVAQSCSIDLIANVPAELTYQTTNPATNAPTGTANTPVDIAVGGAQSFVISVTLTAEFAPRDAELAYSCDNADTVTPLSGLNTLLLSASNTPVPDVIALAATATADGITRLDSAGNGAFSVASVNVGAGANINVSANTGTAAAVALCQSDPTTAVCINPTTPTFGNVAVDISTNGTPTFSVFASSATPIASDAANNRISVVFTGADGNVRGQTSVAVQSAN